MGVYYVDLVFLSDVSHSEVTKSHHMLSEQVNKSDAQNK